MMPLENWESRQLKLITWEVSWHSNLYTNKEKAALEYTDILNKGVAPNFETYHQKMAQLLQSKRYKKLLIL